MAVIVKWFPFIQNLRKRNRLLGVLGILGFILILHFTLWFENSKHESVFLQINIDVPEDFVPNRVTEREIFPSGGKPKVPKILHQTWKDTDVPGQFVPWIQAWLKHHPDWEYWLWTDDSAELLIAQRYPNFLDTYRGYTEPIRRADALRYIVLYEFGGVYADMDMEALTPLDPLTLKYSCFIGQEPYEHPVLDTNFEQLLINAIIGCRKGHPFMKLLVDSLPKYAMLWHFLDSTGPHFVTNVYREYVRKEGDGENSVYVAPSEYFYPVMDPDKIHMFVHKCNKANYLSDIQIVACRNLKFKQLPANSFDAREIAFTDHHWFHTYLKSLLSILKSHKQIFDIVPKVKIYPDKR